MGVRNDYSLFRPFAIKFHYISGTPPAFIQHDSRKQHMFEGMDSTTVGKHDHSVDCDYMYLLAKISFDIAANECPPTLRICSFPHLQISGSFEHHVLGSFLASRRWCGRLPQPV